MNSTRTTIPYIGKKTVEETTFSFKQAHDDSFYYGLVEIEGPFWEVNIMLDGEADGIYNGFEGFGRSKDLYEIHIDLDRNTQEPQVRYSSLGKGFESKAKKESLANHTYDLPTNFGDLVLQNTPPSDPDTKNVYDLIQQRLLRLRSEGVTDKDIKWWWNFSQIERSMIIKNDEAEHYNFYVTQLLKTQTQFPKKESAQSAAEAITNKRFPVYTQDLRDYFISPDDPLPYELKDRVDSFMANASRSPDF